MNRYQVTLVGQTPLLMHKDNISFSEQIKKWQMDPQNKELSVAGDDRSPAWTWIGYLYHDGKHLGVDADCLMTMLREGGAKMPTGKGKETYKKQTQYGLQVDQIQFDLVVNDGLIDIGWIEPLIGVIDFSKHEEDVKAHGFELFCKRAVVGRGKHVRVRPRFDKWACTGTITVIDEEQSGLTEPVLKRILDLSGAMVGLCDWRPSSRSSGSFGKFTVDLQKI